MIDLPAILLHPKIAFLRVNQELREVVKLGDNFPHVGHLPDSVVEAVGEGGEESVRHVEFAALQLLRGFGVWVAADQVLQHDRHV